LGKVTLLSQCLQWNNEVTFGVVSLKLGKTQEL